MATARRDAGVCEGPLTLDISGVSSSALPSSSATSYCVLIGNTMIAYVDIHAYQRGDHPTLQIKIVGASAWNKTVVAGKNKGEKTGVETNFRIVSFQGTNLSCAAPTASDCQVWLAALHAGLEASYNSNVQEKPLLKPPSPQKTKSGKRAPFREKKVVYCQSCGRLDKDKLVPMNQSIAPLPQYGSEFRSCLCPSCLVSQGVLTHVQTLCNLYASEVHERSALATAREVALKTAQEATPEEERPKDDCNSSSSTDAAGGDQSSWTQVGFDTDGESDGRTNNNMTGSWTTLDTAPSHSSEHHWINIPPSAASTKALLDLMKSAPFGSYRSICPLLDVQCRRMEAGDIGCAAEFFEALDEATGRRDGDEMGALKKQALVVAGDMGTAMKLLQDNAVPTSTELLGDHHTEMLACLLEFLLDLCDEGELSSVAFFWPQLRCIHLRMLPPTNANELARVELFEDFLLTVSTKYSVQLAIELVWGYVADLEDSLYSTTCAPACRRRRFAVMRFLCELESLMFDSGCSWGGGSVSLRGMLMPSTHQISLLQENMETLQEHRKSRAVSPCLSHSMRMDKLKQHSAKFTKPPEEAAHEALRITKNADYFSSHLSFTRRLGDIAEKLRFMEVEARAGALDRELNLLNSSGGMGGDPLNRVLENEGHMRVVRVPCGEGHVFRSKERTPVLLLMEVTLEGAEDNEMSDKEKNHIDSQRPENGEKAGAGEEAGNAGKGQDSPAVEPTEVTELGGRRESEEKENDKGTVEDIKELNGGEGESASEKAGNAGESQDALVVQSAEGMGQERRPENEEERNNKDAMEDITEAHGDGEASACEEAGDAGESQDAFVVESTAGTEQEGKPQNEVEGNSKDKVKDIKEADIDEDVAEVSSESCQTSGGTDTEMDGTAYAGEKPAVDAQSPEGLGQEAQSENEEEEAKLNTVENKEVEGVKDDAEVSAETCQTTGDTKTEEVGTSESGSSLASESSDIAEQGKDDPVPVERIVDTEDVPVTPRQGRRKCDNAFLGSDIAEQGKDDPVPMEEIVDTEDVPVTPRQGRHALGKLKRFDTPIAGISGDGTPATPNKEAIEDLVTNVMISQLKAPDLSVNTAASGGTTAGKAKSLETDENEKVKSSRTDEPRAHATEAAVTSSPPRSPSTERGSLGGGHLSQSRKMSAFGSLTSCGGGDSGDAADGDMRREVLTTIWAKGKRGTNVIARGAAEAAKQNLQAMDRKRAVELILDGEELKDDPDAAGNDEELTANNMESRRIKLALSLGLESSEVELSQEEESPPSDEDEAMESLRLLLIQNRVAQGSLSLENAARALAPIPRTSSLNQINSKRGTQLVVDSDAPQIDAGDVDPRLSGCGPLPSAVLSALILWKGGEVSEAELLELVKKDLQFQLHSSLPGAANTSKLIEDSAFWGRFAFGERWAEKKARIAATSPRGCLPGWDLLGVIVKSNDDLRQEAFVMQLIELCQEAFEIAGLELWVQPYRILATGRTTGVIEMVRNAMSFDALKKRQGYGSGRLRGHLERMAEFSADPEDALRSAQLNFVRSLAAYSLMSYIFLFKDRHNGNILLTTAGHVLSIDFGFVMGIAPGGSFSLEMSTPFKLTEEMIEVMGGLRSELFSEFITLFCCGFLALQAHADTFLTIVEITCNGSSFKCFEGKDPADVVAGLRERFCLHLSKEDTIVHCLSIISAAVSSYGTRQYDLYQYWSQGIAA